MKVAEWNTIRFHQKNENSFYSVQRPNDGFSITFYPLPEDLCSLANFLKYDTTVNYLSLDNYNSGNQPYTHRFKVYRGPGADWHEISAKWQPVLDALSYNRTVIDFKAALNYEYSPIGIIIKQWADRNKKQVDSLTEFMKNETQHFNPPKDPSEKAKYDQNFKLYQLFKGFLDTRHDYHFSEATNGIHKEKFSKIVVTPTEFDSVQFEPFSAYDLYKKQYYIEKKIFNILDNYIDNYYFAINGVAKKINGHFAQILDNNLIVAKILSYLGSNNLFQVSNKNINASDYNGQTQLHLDCRLLDSNSVQRSIDLGANINQLDNDGYNALHRAVENSKRFKPGAKEKVIKLLVLNGIDINAQTKNLQLTPLHFTAKLDDANATQLLVGLGACLNIMNHGNRTPLQTAERAGSFAALNVLMNAFKLEQTLAATQDIDHINNNENIEILGMGMNDLG